MKQKEPNELGLYDMTGNVWEWCNDRSAGSYYANSPEHNPQGPGSGRSRVMRGGSWDSVSRSCRLSYRNGGVLGYRFINCGLRLALLNLQC